MLTKKEEIFLEKWSVIRKKGKTKYILIKGATLGLILFSIWLSITIVEINLSAFERMLYSEYTSNFIAKCVVYFVFNTIIGFVLANVIWKRNEEKMHYLS